MLWKESSLQRVRNCGRVPLGDGVGLVLDDGIAHYTGLPTCGSIWACPVCAGKIRASRAAEISAAAKAWSDAGNGVFMVTLTAPHDRYGDKMRLSALMRVIADSFSKVIAGRAWLRVKEQARVAGTIRSVEVTHGLKNGWHPHLHALIFTEGDPGAEGLCALTLHIKSKWKRSIVAAGYRPPSELHGVVIDRCASPAAAAEYIAKDQDGPLPGNELARGDMKLGRDGNRTPFQIIGDFATWGDAEDLALWHEYEKGTRAHQCITWSRGLKALLRVEERSDTELAEEGTGGELVVRIDRDGWRVVTEHDGLEADLLDAAEQGGSWAVVGLLADYGIRPAME